MREVAWIEREIRPFGLEIELKLDQPWPESFAARLPELFARHKLLLFRNQRLSEERQVELMALLGPVLGAAGEYRELSSDGNLGDGPLAWHSDLAFTEKPFQAISLLATEVNDGQSWTAFTNGADCAAALPGELADRLAGLEATTVISMIQSHRAVGWDVPEFLPSQTRPLLASHPKTGEPVLYISEMQTARVEGLPREESDALLADLFARLYAAERVYRHHWENGDLLVWDNFALQHSRCDLAGMHPRRMQRIVCATKSFFELLPQFSLDDPRIAAWGQGSELALSEGD
ncbi:MAG: TauD/TfdA family dioxygenase [Sphingomonadaceae bacterium]|nr:TauD/TfdA family dioxygenase [Sphingomonadaceae bacterium]